MFLVGTHIYANFLPSKIIIPTINSTIVRALVAGPCGHGKTYFINNTCNTKYKVGITKGSLTRDIAFQDFAYLPRGKFRIYDTPGSNSSVDALEHALVLRASLTNLKLNLILIQAKFQSRFEQTIAHFAKIMKIFKGYQSLVAFMVSHEDILDKQPNKQEVLSSFGSTLSEYGINCKLIIYSNVNSNFQQLSDILYKIGQCSLPKQIVIDDNTFYKYFNISSPITSLKTKEIDEYIEDIRDKADMCIEFAKEITKEKEKDLDDLLAQLKLFMKYELKRIQYEQYKKYQLAFDENKTTNIYLMISQFIQSKLEQLDQSSYFKISKYFYDDHNKKSSDIRDMFRACPNCSLIWMKVQGCDGQTTCGNKPDFYDYFKNKELHTYEFIQEKGKMKYKKKEQKRLPTSSNKSQQEKFFKYKLATTEKGVGCGKTFNWGQTQRIPNIDSILKNIYNVSNFEEIKLELNQLKSEKKQYSKALDDKVKDTLNVMKRDKIEQNYYRGYGYESNGSNYKPPIKVQNLNGVSNYNNYLNKTSYDTKFLTPTDKKPSFMFSFDPKKLNVIKKEQKK